MQAEPDELSDEAPRPPPAGPPPKRQRQAAPDIYSESVIEERACALLDRATECSVCFELPLCNMLQCQNGHLICQGCVDAGALARDCCPTCKADTSEGLQRNRAVEAVNARVTRKCGYCDFAARADAFAAHVPCKRFYDRKVSCVNGDGRKMTYRGLAGEESIAEIFDPERGTTQYLEGPAGSERVVKGTFRNGQVTHYAGVRGEERRVKSVLCNGEVHLYQGLARAERKTRAVMPDGTVQNYVGERRRERLVERVERAAPQLSTPDSTVYERVTTTRFTGAKGAEYMEAKTIDFPDAPWSERVAKRFVYEGTARGAERLVQCYVCYVIQFTEDDKEHVVSFTWYEGPPGQERMTKCTNRDDKTTRKYEGAKGEERLVEVVRECVSAGLRGSRTERHQGPAGEERMVSARTNDGVRIDYDGPRGRERVTRKTVGCGAEGEEVHTFTGPCGNEELAEIKTPQGATLTYVGGAMLRALLPDGTRRDFIGATGKERLVREVHANGTTLTFEGARGSEWVISTVEGPTYGAAVSLQRVLGIGRGADHDAGECAQ